MIFIINQRSKAGTLNKIKYQRKRFTDPCWIFAASHNHLICVESFSNSFHSAPLPIIMTTTTTTKTTITTNDTTTSTTAASTVITVIHRWSAPRSCSTALLYSFEARARAASNDDKAPTPIIALDESLYREWLLRRGEAVARPYREALIAGQAFLLL